ncbi:hypothetical protein OESDEN_16933 [Oesophagostomum dentatum]|uniref:Uncharacterized protein n=1 Tax=Oesophagostomum dentatum TaxID=61180 RepID=A0A0B1SJG0_OESDE|nr:hypothetical protein OESDEN_16933 [Oesophagostomum dentatum]
MLPLLFCFIFVVAFKEAHAYKSSGRIELVLASTHKGTGNSEIDTFYDLLHDFARSHQHYFDRGNFLEYDTNINDLPVAKFGLDLVNCDDLLEFLRSIKPKKYHLKYASVKCGGQFYPLCLIPPCDPEKYKA